MDFHPHPDVWAFIGGLLVVYVWLLRREREDGGAPVATRLQKAAFISGVLSMWVVLDLLHEVAERHLYYVHTIQHIVLSLVAPPLLLIGMPAQVMRRILGRGLLLEVARRLTRPVPALLIFNAVIALIHWPVLVEAMSRQESVHVGVHLGVIGASLIMWTPVLSPLMELPKLSYPGRMFYLFLQSIVPTVPASFLTFASTPFYRIYAEAPRLFGITALDDLRMAGLIMKLGGGFILWGIITVLFFKWYSIEQEEGVDVLAWRDVDRELNRASFRTGES